MADIRPLFLFSLPRSGSTLAQRVLAAHPEVATASEPWLLLPFLYARRKGLYAEYDHNLYRQALDDFLQAMPDGEDAYREALRRFAVDLYGRAAPAGARFFLDKTPRYSLVAREIVDTFPDGRFLVLWRNPLAVLASMIETWAAGRWNVYLFRVDLFDGLAALIELVRRRPDAVCTARYEDLVGDPEAAWKDVFACLRLSFDADVLTHFADVPLRGRMGDPTDLERYGRISTASLERWSAVLSTPLRRRWVRRYLRWIGRERLALMGYDLDALEADLATAPMSLRYLASDVWHMSRGWLYPWVEPSLALRKRTAMRAAGSAVAHD